MSSDEDIRQTSFISLQEDNVEKRLRSIVQTLRKRTEKVKNYVEQPPTPTDDSEEELEATEENKVVRELILEDFTESRYASKKSLLEQNNGSYKNLKERFKFSGYIDPRGKLNIG